MLISVHKLVVCSIAISVLGCKGKPKHQVPPTNVEVPGGSGSGSAPKASPDLVLPRGTGLPPMKTTKPVDLEVFNKLAALKYPGFEPERRGNDKVLELRQMTTDHPKILTDAVIGPCNNDCVPMDLAKWKDKTEALKEFLAPDLRTAPDTVFEVGQTELNGQPMIYTYQLAQKFKPGGSGLYSEMYVLYFNDGVNQIRVGSHYADDPLQTKEDLAKSVSKEDLENVAKGFLDVYTQGW